MAFILLLLKVPDRETTKLPTKKKLLQLDVVGTTCLVPGSISLLLALQWGGLTHPVSACNTHILVLTCG
jgi:hypothetical protein